MRIPILDSCYDTRTFISMFTESNIAQTPLDHAPPRSLRLCHHYRMPNDEPKKSEGKFSEVARKSREKRAAMEQQKRDEDAGFPERGSNGGADVKDS